MIPLKSDKKQIKLYGDIIIDFANAKNSDEACNELIKGVQKAFNFSTNFIKESKKIMPSLMEFKSKFSKQEKVLMKLVLIEKDLKDFLDSQFGLLNQTLKDYDSENNTLTLQDIILYGGVFEGEIDVDVEYTRPYSMDIKDIESHEWEMMEPRTFDKLKQLMKVGKKIKRFKQNISEERYSELEELYKTYQIIRAKHTQVNSLHKKVIKTLNEIVKTKKLYGNENFSKFLGNYRVYCKLDEYLLPDDTFGYKADFIEENYYLKGSSTHAHRKSFAYTLVPIPFFLVEFLNQPKNKELIHICDECNDFYISQSIREQRFCSKKCRLKWHNRKDIESGKRKQYKRDRKFNEKVIKEKGEAPASYFG